VVKFWAKLVSKNKTEKMSKSGFMLEFYVKLKEARQSGLTK
jgi:hypothetical protein